MVNTKLVNINLLILTAIIFVLALFPNLDLGFSEFFYEESGGFVYKNKPAVLFFFKLMPIITSFIVIGLIIYFIFQKFFPYCKNRAIYIAFSIALGPGLLTNFVLKENIGRARPAQIKEFGGGASFSSVLKNSDQCISNCSFPSGHASSAFQISAFAYALVGIKKSRKLFNYIYSGSFFFGILVGLSRIAAGGHFLSDSFAASIA